MSSMLIAYKQSGTLWEGQFRSSLIQQEEYLFTYHALYQSLGSTDEERQVAYRELFRHGLESGEIDKIRKATIGNFALGTDRFHEEISKMIGRRVFPGKVGRPKKKNIEA